MFFVADRPEQREKKIRKYLDEDPMIAILLAAANFEWTAGRCILFFSPAPNVSVRERLAACHGLKKYKELWNNELVKHDPSIPPLAQVVTKWAEFEKVFKLRHRLIHGRATCSRQMAIEALEFMLAAANDLNQFAGSRGKDLHQRAPVRRAKKHQ